MPDTMPKPDKMIKKLKEGKIPADEIDKIIDIWYVTNGEPEKEEAKDFDVPDKDQDEQAEPSDTESEPPVKPNPGPENPEDRNYSPEKNVDGSGGGTGSDPPCTPFFRPSVARMKRCETYNMIIPGGRDGYDMYISPPEIKKMKELDTRPEPKDPKNYVRFEGEVTLDLSDSIPTALFMPTVETHISDYELSDGGKVMFLVDGLDNVYVQALSGGYREGVTIKYTVWCKHSTYIDNLLYYYQDYDDKATLQDAYDWGVSVGHDYENALSSQFRRLVPDVLEVINPEYFKDMIDTLRDMPVPGMALDDKDDRMDRIRPKYNFKRVVEIIAGYTMSFGCSDIPKGDMVLASVKAREGACRHRALVFFVVGTTLGIPNRYCCSDCHAYSEVYFGNIKRWVGMDLGGCSPGKPEPPENEQTLIDKFRHYLLRLGWKEDEDRFKVAMKGAREVGQ